MTPPDPSLADAREAASLLDGITSGNWFAENLPPNGWTIWWAPGAPIAHMRWTDGMRPEVEARIEAEAKFIAAAPRLVRSLLARITALEATLAGQGPAPAPTQDTK